MFVCEKLNSCFCWLFISILFLAKSFFSVLNLFLYVWYVNTACILIFSLLFLARKSKYFTISYGYKIEITIRRKIWIKKSTQQSVVRGIKSTGASDPTLILCASNVTVFPRTLLKGHCKMHYIWPKPQMKIHQRHENCYRQLNFTADVPWRLNWPLLPFQE